MSALKLVSDNDEVIESVRNRYVVRVSMNLDFGHIADNAQDLDPQMVEELITKLLVVPARAQATRALHETRTSDLDPECKAVAMAGSLRAIMLTLMAQANITVEPLPHDTVVHTELPFERNC